MTRQLVIETDRSPMRVYCPIIEWDNDPEHPLRGHPHWESECANEKEGEQLWLAHHCLLNSTDVQTAPDAEIGE